MRTGCVFIFFIEVFMPRHKFTWRHVVRKLLSLVFSRLVVTGVLLLVQIVWLFILFYRLSDYAAWLNGVGWPSACSCAWRSSARIPPCRNSRSAG